MKDAFWLLGGMLHAFLHPDSSFLCFWQAGFSAWQIIMSTILFSSIGIVMLYFLNQQGAKLISSKKNILGGFWGKQVLCAVKRFGYFGMILVLFIPGVPGLKEVSLLAGQLIGLRYTLSIVLICNALRIFVLFIFSFKVLF